ncbi:MAG: AtpZ/AtpI family protein [Phycisphaerales bacterium]|nr:AtpZ/AtpI family protein [Phycisphaerales bacterium]
MLPSGGSSNSDTAGIWRMTGLGWTMLCEILAGGLVGWGLDWLLETDRVFLIIGLIAGVLVGMTGFIRAALKETRRNESKGEKSD